MLQTSTKETQEESQLDGEGSLQGIVLKIEF